MEFPIEISRFPGIGKPTQVRDGRAAPRIIRRSRLIWSSNSMGTYIKKVYGPIGVQAEKQGKAADWAVRR